MRRMEIDRCDKMARAQRDLKIRRERCKWKVSDVRRNVIKRTRIDLEHHREFVKQFEPKELLTSVSFQRRRDWLKDEAEMVKELERKVLQSANMNTRLMFCVCLRRPECISRRASNA